MRSPTDFLVKPIDGKRYNNTKVIDGVEVYISVSDEDYTVSNREAEVIALPLNYEGPIKIGDTLLVHHNVFKFYNDTNGEKKSGKSYFRDGLYLIDDMQYYMYNNGNGWNAVGRYNLLEPVKATKGILHKGFEHEPLQGRMRYPSPKMIAMGVKEGDVFIYTPQMASEYRVEGEDLLRLYDKHLTVKL